MSCGITRGKARLCQFQIGGVTTAYLADWRKIVSWTAAVDGTLTDVLFLEYTITGVTNAAPPVVTAAGNGLVEGARIFITGTSPMTGLIGEHTVGNVLTTATFELEGEDSTAWGAYGVTNAVVQDGGWYEVEVDQATSSGTGEFVVSNGNRYFNNGMNILIPSADNETRALVTELALGKTVGIWSTNEGNLKVFGKMLGMQMVTAPFTTGVAYGDFAGFNVTLSGADFESFYIYDDTTHPLQVFTN
jgi:hypothetical protein